ncbi:HTH_Tnp_Tc3_2 domain-containing protein [Trichonephila clavipes]|nr:HTH_Tnp_Tc3_2 domain-containing protein [Trichonephila clavipes]
MADVASVESCVRVPMPLKIRCVEQLMHDKSIKAQNLPAGVARIYGTKKNLEDFLRGRIIGRLECGRTQLEVSEKLGIAQSVISRLWQRFQGDGNVSRCYSTGRSRVTTPNEGRYLAVTAKRNRRSTASDLSRQLSTATGTTVSRQTVYRRLGPIGLYARRPVRCVPLTATHCRLRLTWSREHTLWTPQQWSTV